MACRQVEDDADAEIGAEVAAPMVRRSRLTWIFFIDGFRLGDVEAEIGAEVAAPMVRRSRLTWIFFVNGIFLAKLKLRRSQLVPLISSLDG